ncbi:MAG: arsenate reductase ArsC [Candidatus Mcinerneyibacterium aminivorans]|uniref:Arsenate reductase ArsC n=1 Tax=Candidatus Mcinerneyibacterium aminivorans TaxID=2703815 RepID=A0A5D0MDL6_9BACT|nr:MAG: arsenate reductase ArsC [Candidatus Mcinerneyibacterium aminivorans]
MKKKTVLFICTHNSARSQMAEGLVNNIYNDKLKAYSAGTEKTQVKKLAIDAMKEINIDISDQRSKTIEIFKNKKFDYVVTVCDNAKNNCPFFPGAKRYFHASFEDPSEVNGSYKNKLDAFIKTRNKINKWIKKNLMK